MLDGRITSLVQLLSPDDANVAMNVSQHSQFVAESVLAPHGGRFLRCLMGGSVPRFLLGSELCGGLEFLLASASWCVWLRHA